MIAQYIPVAMSAILIVAIGFEVRTGRIPNWLTLLPFLLFFAVLIWTDRITEFYWQLGLAAAVFAFGLLMFAVAGFGAGAVKLMTGLALFVPLDTAFYTFLTFMAAFFVSAVVIVQLRKIIGSEQSKWHVMSKAVLPMSIPIGIAGLAAFFWL